MPTEEQNDNRLEGMSGARASLSTWASTIYFSRICVPCCWKFFLSDAVTIVGTKDIPFYPLKLV